MANVNPIEGITYGFRLLGYVIAVFIVGFILLAIGGAMTENSPIIGGLLALAGFLVIYAGFLGIGYKVIADGVEKGINASQMGAGGGQQSRASRRSAGQQRQQQQRQQGQRQQQQRQQGQQSGQSRGGRGRSSGQGNN